MAMPNDYALIIGVEDYAAYDRSMDLPAGTNAVTGALNDAKTFVRQCTSMGLAPERLRVITSPRLSPEDLGPEGRGVTLGDATHDSIVAGITWLAQAISGAEPSAGLLTFSGHGTQSSGVGVALCPSDTTGSLEQLVHVAELRRQIGRGKVADNLTMLLDCCHAQVGADRGTSLRARLRALPEGVDPEKLGVAERVIAACGRDQVSESSQFGGRRNGAFTWAITSAMGQWKAVDEDGVTRLDVAYGELVRRTRALLEALSFTQVPVLSGPPGVATLAFLHPGLSRHPGEVDREPDAPRGHRQLDAGQKGFRSYDVSIVDATGALYAIARVIVTNTSGTFYYTAQGVHGTATMAMSAGVEYWFSDPTVLANLRTYAAGGSLGFSEDRSPTVDNGYDWAWTDVSATAPVAMGSCTDVQSASASATWVAASGPWPRLSIDFGSSTTGAPLYAVAINTTVNGQGATVLGVVTWYQTGASPLAPNALQLPAAASGSTPQTYCPLRQSGQSAPSAF